MTRRAMMAGNWKMHKNTAEAQAFVEALWERVQGHDPKTLPEIVLCPPFTALSTVQDAARRIGAPFIVAAQTMESRDSGAYTGEVSPAMLLDLDVRWVILGHSERRQYYNETNETVAAKTAAALKHSMVPIVCVGETLEEREAGETDAVISRQVAAVLQVIEPHDVARLVVAYEPVWAIGTGKTCDAGEANRVCELIRKLLTVHGPADQTPILYGGSVKPDNARELVSQPDIDGGLVGGASLEAESFYKIIEQTSLVGV